MEGSHPAFSLALALAVGVLAQSLARHIRLPGILPLLVAGVLLGPDVLGWVEPGALGQGLFEIVGLAVGVILFEGAMQLQIPRLRREQAAIRRLVSLGALVTWVGGALATAWVFEWGAMQSLLFGSLVVVTGPTVIGPLVRELRLRPRVATVLEAEGVLIDPVGAFLAVLLLEVVIAQEAEGLVATAASLLARVGWGAGAGALAGFAIANALRRHRLVPQGMENIFVLSAVLLLYAGCDVVVSESGILAVVVAGMVVGNLPSRSDRDLRDFKDQIRVLLIGMLFVLLAADVRIADVLALGWRGLAVVLLLLFAVRPAGVWLCTRGAELTGRERAFLALVAPRGIVAAAVASLTANALGTVGPQAGVELRALVFLTIAVSVVWAGAAGPLLARWLGVRMPAREGAAILGAQGLGLLLGEALRAGGRPVVFLDSNPASARLATEAGFAVVFGDALQERTLQRARLDAVGAACGATANQLLNSVFVSRARDEFRVPHGYIAVLQPKQGIAQELSGEPDVHLLFDAPHDVERWEVRHRHGDVALEAWRFAGRPESEASAAGGDAREGLGEHAVVLAVRRGRRSLPMRPDLGFAAGDVVSVAIYEPERADAERELAHLGLARETATAAAP